MKHESAAYSLIHCTDYEANFRKIVSLITFKAFQRSLNSADHFIRWLFQTARTSFFVLFFCFWVAHNIQIFTVYKLNKVLKKDKVMSENNLEISVVESFCNM